MLSFSGNYFQRYWLAVLPFFILASYRALDRRWFIAASAVMLVVSGHGVYEASASQECQQPLEQSLDYVEDLEGDVVSDSWAVSGYILDRKVYSPYTDYEELRDQEGVRYAVVEDQSQYEELASFTSECRTYRVYDLENSISSVTPSS
jgi:hypothetical protein